MSEEKTKRFYTEQSKLFNVAPMDEWGENQKGLNGTIKIA